VSEASRQYDRNGADHFATCPKCGELSEAGRYSCATCGAYLIVTGRRRQRSFCRYCGTMTTYLDACCDRHRDLLPFDHLTSADVRSAPQAAPEREDTIPTKGTEA
jgi:hypothetical protein